MIVVVGSFMMDLVVRTDRAPGAGETLIGRSFGRFPGGKGANQAVACARLGGEVAMAGKLGNDAFGEEFRAVLAQEEIDATHVLVDDIHSTGVGSIVVEANGQNRIIVVPGANQQYSIADIERIESVIAEASILIMQLEMDMAMTETAVRLAHKHNVPVILNPAPAQALSDELLKGVAYLTPNETEAELLTGIPVKNVADAEKAARALHERGVRHVIVTLAEKGAIIVDSNGVKHVPGFPVKPIDTVAAGDSFNGALAVQIVQGTSLPEAVEFANAVGALTVLSEGAIPSLPRLDNVNAFIAVHRENA